MERPSERKQYYLTTGKMRLQARSHVSLMVKEGRNPREVTLIRKHRQRRLQDSKDARRSIQVIAAGGISS
jgi:hypothetical protein